MLCFGKSKKIKNVKDVQKDFSKSSIQPRKSSHESTKAVGRFANGKTMDELIQTALKTNISIENGVLPTIFNYLTVNELLKIRLVSRLWNRVSCNLLREKMEGVIILQRGLGYFTKMMSSSIEIPIGRIFLNIIDMDDPQPKTFFKMLGHSVYYLILNLEGRSVSQFQQNLHFLINMKQLSLNLFNQVDRNSRRRSTRPNVGFDLQILIEDYDEVVNNNNKTGSLILPSLESFILSCESNWKSNQPILVEQIINASPNLKNINFSKWPFPLKHDLFQASKLEHLQFITLTYIGNETLKSLASKHMHLKSADFCLDYGIENETFDKFIESVSASLEYIRLENKTNPDITFRLKNPMPRLFTVRLTSWVGPIWLDSISTKCDHLIKLQLGNCNPSTVTMKYPKPNPNVKYLATCFGNYSSVSAKIRSELVKNYILMFPNLECFMMKQVSDKTIGQIIGGWSKLKTLRVTSGIGLTDSGLTGIPIAELSKMTKLENKLPCGCCLPFPVVDSKPSIDAVVQYPCIGDLHDLVDLSIESEEGSHFPLTNFALHLGLHKLAKLKSLKITCHNELGPHWCFKSIADNLSNLKELTVMDRSISHDRYEEHEVAYLLRKLPNLKLNLPPANISNLSTKAF